MKQFLTDWVMHYESHRNLACRVPCSMYSVLLQHKLIDDPYYRDNEYGLTDYSRKDCVFEAAFRVTAGMLAKKHLELVFHGIDTVADIYINGVHAVYADNMHYAAVVDVKPLVTEGENRVKLHIHSPVEYMEEKQRRHPVWGQEDTMTGFANIRKSSCMMGWDWAPKLPDMGIYRDVELCAFDAKIEDVYVRQKHMDGKVTLDIACEIRGKYKNAAVTLTAPDGNAYRYPLCSERCEITVEEPMLWWPNGYGQQNLYSVTVTADGAEEKAVNIGLRTLTVSTAPDAYGQEFCFVCNGIKLFAMGADYIPEDSLIANLTPARTETLIKSCAAANHNAIRVWGGGFYPHEYFYDACDKYGIIVWQDFMFACVGVRLSPWFLDTMKKELIYNIKRLRSRACLGLFCGNNELEEFYMNWIKNQLMHKDYLEFFEHFVPDICDEYAPDIFYWPSSPSSGGGFHDPRSDDKGDQHYWGAWHGSIPFESYRQHYFRFCSEFGFEAFPSLKTIDSFCAEEDKNPLSPVMEAHQKCRTGMSRLLSYMSDKYRYPTDLKSFVYASQILQADAIRYGVEHFRRFRGRCMGAIYWQLNDCWPVASWASLDYYGRWKALHYASRRFFAPVLLSLHEEGTTVTANISNETRADFAGTVKYGIRTVAFDTLCEKEIAVSAGKLQSCDIFTEDFSARVCGREREVYLFAALYDGQHRLVSSTSVLFAKPKQVKFRKPSYTWELCGGQGCFTLTLSSDVYTKFTQLDFTETDALFADNFFDLISGEVKEIPFTVQDKTVTAEQLRARLDIFSINDMT